ncbi:TetR/AcrR family transcriptional regulator [Sodalis ligni]|uniref:TetR/AcrR family transcriptional regulator n=1 Tax=Sodalis ligni TaxID=2697027 RepID=UPI00193F5877|nr:TetR/AcrR family transcriptional regulator [Sodalis ligni]QWA10013.1 TetR/AcrR family transcriptional regulator [Sodalis ligni]
MKISRDHLADNRRRILDAAAQLMREQGFENVSIADVTKAAGLTHGAFYNHFKSKDDLIAKVFEHVLFLENGQSPYADLDLKTFGQNYLTTLQRDNLGNGCMFSALGCEIPRTSPETVAITTRAIKAQIERFSQTAPGNNAEERRRVAISRWSAMVGAMILARAVDDEALSEELLSQTLASFEP